MERALANPNLWKKAAHSVIACVLLEGALAAGSEDTLHAQGTTVGVASTATAVTVRFDVASRLTVAVEEAPRAIGAEEGSTLFALPLRIRANQGWRLLVSQPASLREGRPELEVQDADGVWRLISAGEVVAVTDATGPTDLFRLSVKIRRRGPATLLDLAKLRLELEPVEPPR